MTPEERFQERVLNTLEDIQRDVTWMKVQYAKLPSEFVKRHELEQARAEAKSARRWAITTFMSVVVPLIAVFVNTV